MLWLLILCQIVMVQLAVSGWMRSWENKRTEIPLWTPSCIIRKDGQQEPATKKTLVVKDLDKQTAQAAAMGLLYAGKAEFNWIVDIRLDATDQEMWSIGNLITYYHVITTCRALSSLVPIGKKAQPNSPERIKVRGDIEVFFGMTYLFEKNYVESRMDVSGKRVSRLLTAHPLCSLEQLMYDFGLIELSTGISALTPIRGYMPVLLDQYSDSPDVSPVKEHRMVCHVAAFGRQYRNIHTYDYDIIEDSKIKFRVYYVNHLECVKYFEKICPSEHPACKLTIMRKSKDNVMCFRPRKKVGAICDHHRGAPLVCNGYVYGLVIHAVNRTNCHNLIQYPALVLQVSAYTNDLYRQIMFGTINPLSRAAGARSHPFTFLIVATMVIYFSY